MRTKDIKVGQEYAVVETRDSRRDAAARAVVVAKGERRNVRGVWRGKESDVRDGVVVKPAVEGDEASLRRLRWAAGIRGTNDDGTFTVRSAQVVGPWASYEADREARAEQERERLERAAKAQDAAKDLQRRLEQAMGPGAPEAARVHLPTYPMQLYGLTRDAAERLAQRIEQLQRHAEQQARQLADLGERFRRCEEERDRLESELDGLGYA